MNFGNRSDDGEVKNFIISFGCFSQQVKSNLRVFQTVRPVLPKDNPTFWRKHRNIKVKSPSAKPELVWRLIGGNQERGEISPHLPSSSPSTTSLTSYANKPPSITKFEFIPCLKKSISLKTFMKFVSINFWWFHIFVCQSKRSYLFVLVSVRPEYLAAKTSKLCKHNLFCLKILHSNIFEFWANLLCYVLFDLFLVRCFAVNFGSFIQIVPFI